MTFPTAPIAPDGKPLYRQPRPSQAAPNALVKGPWPDADEPVEPTTWCIVWTHPSVEERVARNLERIGFSTFLPMHVKWRELPRRICEKTKRPRRERVERPLMPRYLFVGFDPARQLRHWIGEALGVSAVIHAEGACQGRLAEAIGALMLASDLGDHDDTLERRKPVVTAESAKKLAEVASEMVGKPVRIAAPFDAAGIVVAARGKRVEVEVGKRRLVVPADAVSVDEAA